jgi:hypothetical protein
MLGIVRVEIRQFYGKDNRQRRSFKRRLSQDGEVPVKPHPASKNLRPNEPKRLRQNEAKWVRQNEPTGKWRNEASDARPFDLTDLTTRHDFSILAA